MEKRDLWTPEKRLALLPNFPRISFLQEAEFLHYELTNNKLKVVLIPAPSPRHACHMIRFAESHNPYWYGSIYYSHSRGKRKSFENSLLRLINNNDQDFNPKTNQYMYDTVFRWLAYSRLVEGYIGEDGLRVFPDNEIRAFFGLEEVLDCPYKMRVSF